MVREDWISVSYTTRHFAKTVEVPEVCGVLVSLPGHGVYGALVSLPGHGVYGALVSLPGHGCLRCTGITARPRVFTMHWYHCQATGVYGAVVSLPGNRCLWCTGVTARQWVFRYHLYNGSFID